MRAARQLVAKIVALDPKDPFRSEKTDLLLAKLSVDRALARSHRCRSFKTGLIPSTTSLAACEKLAASTFCRRRLPIVLVRLKMAENAKEAVELVEHGRLPCAAAIAVTVLQTCAWAPMWSQTLRSSSRGAVADALRSLTRAARWRTLSPGSTRPRSAATSPSTTTRCGSVAPAHAHATAARRLRPAVACCVCVCVLRVLRVLRVWSADVHFPWTTAWSARRASPSRDLSSAAPLRRCRSATLDTACSRASPGGSHDNR